MANMEEISRWSHLQGFDMPFACGQEIWILIGQDAPAALIPLEVRRAASGPYAVRNITRMVTAWSCISNARKSSAGS